jgi:CheY-like chemotaxis protein
VIARPLFAKPVIVGAMEGLRGCGTGVAFFQQSIMRILITDDEQAIREILEIVCGDEGHETRTARTVAEALEVWRQWSPDCIVLDLGLPGVTGLELVRHLRRGGDQTPIVIISGNLLREWVAELEQLGVTAIVPKPFQVDRIVDLLQRISAGG